VGGRFRGLLVHSILGQGAMVFGLPGKSPDPPNALVIKNLPSHRRCDIFREAHLAARIASPNVVGVLDAGYEAGVPFVIQRYIDGIDLNELINQMRRANWRLPVNMICQILIDSALGLHAIHQAGIVHRDVKPANLFLRGNGTSTVGDFGIAFDTVKEKRRWTDGGNAKLHGT
jgi:serine/threonine protein kinase